MKELGGILYNDEPNETYTKGRAKIKIFYPAFHDENMSKKNIETINKICSKIVRDINLEEPQNKGTT